MQRRENRINRINADWQAMPLCTEVMPAGNKRHYHAYLALRGGAIALMESIDYY